MKLKFLLCILLFVGVNLYAQDYFPTNEGVKTQNTNYTVFENAKIHVDPNTVIENGMFAVRDGKITAIGKTINVPANSHRIDLEGKEVYSSFIDLYSEFGIKKPQRSNNNSNQPQYEAEREGYYWNDHIRPETDAVKHFSFNKEEAGKLHKGGFGVVNTHMPDGIIRGTGVLVALNPEGTEGERILADRSSQFLSFDKSVQSRQSYPTSIMGAMALIRQSYMDADWYSKGNSKNRDLALEALNRNKDLLQVFKTDNLLDALRAGKIGREFNINYVILGSGSEYERVNEVKNSNSTFIIPLDFPDAYDVEDPFMANYVSLQDMKRWNQAPANLKVLAENNVPFVITMHNSKDEKKFRENLLKAVSYGLDKKAALAALTTVPARTLKQENNLGTLKQGAWANFIITSGDYFEEETVIYENWVQGRRAILENMSTVDLAGTYDLKVNNTSYEVKITGKPTAPKVEVKEGENKLKSKIAYSDGWMNLLISSADTTSAKFTRLVAQVPSTAKTITGKAILPAGDETTFTATRTAGPESPKNDKKTTVANVVPVTYPNMAYGYKEMPKQENILFRNATVWTNTNDGILTETDVLINNGKITRVGKNLNAGNARVIDATGKHLTSGIIDEHSHIAASAINEAGHNSTAEVTMEDVVDPTDINIYRNLAGGVTTVQLLHGSANPIGGRSAILRLKWGAPAEGLIFKEAPKYIKFALGENVKQSNRSNANRFPQTRMGVEQVFTDYFTRARNYEQEKKNNKNFRRDLEMETLVEILNGERYVTSHSYIQSEINMLMKVAEAFDFRINTFTHILEGYKVADKMKEHGVGASTFSDWWAYKYEVNDAIPYNASILHNVGVTVAINSDDSEMSRRLNQEAAKSMKYGDISEEEAWKFVTLNPAKLLHIDQYVGSVEAGKQADVVLWSDHPLSVYAKAEKTLVEGAVYFDLEKDQELRNEIAQQKNTLLTQMLEAKNGGSATRPVTKKEDQHIHCNTLEVH
ncbi:amidohydrolase family protein [Antarcticibacterium flavum]|uniref:Amidohydrolase family protein n=1 Tax=Antarcticibacterium flavum TaxID=2058175 RepID=A0A5B7X8K3_9FLAO|nr:MULTISPECIES: amidohydrolase family protein [Antarcticibacterium]MCM4159333.1 amidohydrolase [Antarcticibacterium sp. W02-3]QCY70961.1 amidohydrolase family protein [Antarcticibacterium flavum]